MQINVKLKIKGVTDFQVENKEHFEYDLRESVRELLIIQGIDFRDLEVDFDYKEGVSKNE